VGGTGISGEVLIGRKRRWRTKARKNKDVRILREDDLGEVRYRYQVTDCYSDDGCLELVELTRAGRRWRQEVRQRLDRKELERAMANPLGRPLTSWGVYEQAFTILSGGSRRTAERDHWGVVVLGRGELDRGSRWQYRLRLDEERGPLFEWLLLRVDGAGVEWELVVRRWVPTQMLAYLVVQPPRASLLDREAGLEALAQLRALGAWKLGPLSDEELAKLLKEARRLRAARPLIRWHPLAQRQDPQKGHILPDVAPRELELVRIGQGRARVLPCHRPFYDPLAWLLEEELPEGDGEGSVVESPFV
jgi:hypothetical protein